MERSFLSNGETRESMSRSFILERLPGMVSISQVKEISEIKSIGWVLLSYPWNWFYREEIMCARAATLRKPCFSNSFWPFKSIYLSVPTLVSFLNTTNHVNAFMIYSFLKSSKMRNRYRKDHAPFLTTSRFRFLPVAFPGSFPPDPMNLLNVVIIAHILTKVV